MTKPSGLRLLSTGAGAALASFCLFTATASAANISQAYSATGTITNGSIVSLDPQHLNYIQLANSNNGSRLLGVALVNKEPLIVTNDTGTVQVAINGTVNTLVSTVGGDIGVGDQIAPSPFNGVGMKAQPGSYVIGLAQTAFNGTSADAITRQVTDKGGQTHTNQDCYIRIGISAGTYKATQKQTGQSSLQKLAQSLTGHTVSVFRIVLSLVIAFVAFASLLMLIYVSIYSSIICIVRTPLVKSSVFRTLRIVLAMALLITILACVTIVFLLH